MMQFAGGGGGGFSVSRYSSYARDRDLDTDLSSSSSRFSSSRYNPVTSPTSVRRTYAATPSYSSRYIPSSTSRWASHAYSDDEDESDYRYRRDRERFGRREEHTEKDRKERLRDSLQNYSNIKSSNTHCFLLCIHLHIFHRYLYESLNHLSF